jgi:hypothetical protein
MRKGSRKKLLPKPNHPIQGISWRAKQLFEQEYAAWDALPADFKTQLDLERYHEPPLALGIKQTLRNNPHFNIYLLPRLYLIESKKMAERDLKLATTPKEPKDPTK